MKEVEFMIRTNMYAETKKRLAENGFFAFSSKEVLGRGKGNAIFELEDASDESKETVQPVLIATRLIVVWVADDQVDELVKIIIDTNKTGSPGDGKIFVSSVEGGYRIRTGERGEDIVL